MQWTTITLLSHSFMADSVQSLEMNIQDRNILKYSLIDNNFHPHPQVTRRQALPNSEIPTSQDLEYCDSIRNDVFCLSGLGQRVVNISLSCGQSIEEEFTECARSESGAFCGSLVSLNTLTRRYLEGNCSRAITSNICSTQCRNHLETFRSELGCCINAHLNTSSYQSTRLSVNYSLWNLCGVPLPAMECQNHGLNFNVPVTAQKCMNESIQAVNFITMICESDVAQPYINGLLADTRCSQINLNYAKSIINFCSMNPSGEFCFPLVISYEAENNQYIHSICYSEISNVSYSDCRPACRNKLMEGKYALGCCVNHPPVHAFWTSLGIM